MASDRFQKVIESIDRHNAEDPHRIEAGGTSQPYELVYSQWMTDWVQRLEPDPSEELLIAARGQHVQRWTIPRDQYPKDRKGYLLWRETLKQFHAKTVASLMKQAGYPEPSIERVARIILKKNIRDPESQTVEDALCLVFLEHQFSDLRAKEPEQKMIEILQKSWRKMGEKGRATALQLPLADPETALLKKALAPAK